MEDAHRRNSNESKSQINDNKMEKETTRKNKEEDQLSIGKTKYDM